MEFAFNKFNEEYTQHFVTLLTWKRCKYFGEIEGGVMKYTNEGNTAAEEIGRAHV